MFDKHGVVRARKGAWFIPLLSEETSVDMFSVSSFVFIKRQAKENTKDTINIHSVE